MTQITGPHPARVPGALDYFEWLCDEPGCGQIVRHSLKVITRQAVEAHWDWHAEMAARRRSRSPERVGPCPCECNSGQFCGGCGHAGCGGRR